jgi:hypothetical protein
MNGPLLPYCRGSVACYTLLLLLLLLLLSLLLLPLLLLLLLSLLLLLLLPVVEHIQQQHVVKHKLRKQLLMLRYCCSAVWSLWPWRLVAPAWCPLSVVVSRRQQLYAAPH